MHHDPAGLAGREAPGLQAPDEPGRHGAGRPLRAHRLQEQHEGQGAEVDALHGGGPQASEDVLGRPARRGVAAAGDGLDPGLDGGEVQTGRRRGRGGEGVEQRERAGLGVEQRGDRGRAGGGEPVGERAHRVAGHPALPAHQGQLPRRDHLEARAGRGLLGLVGVQVGVGPRGRGELLAGEQAEVAVEAGQLRRELVGGLAARPVAVAASAAPEGRVGELVAVLGAQALVGPQERLADLPDVARAAGLVRPVGADLPQPLLDLRPGHPGVDGVAGGQVVGELGGPPAQGPDHLLLVPLLVECQLLVGAFWSRAISP